MILKDITEQEIRRQFSGLLQSSVAKSVGNIRIHDSTSPLRHMVIYSSDLFVIIENDVYERYARVN